MPCTGHTGRRADVTPSLVLLGRRGIGEALGLAPVLFEKVIELVKIFELVFLDLILVCSGDFVVFVLVAPDESLKVRRLTTARAWNL